MGNLHYLMGIKIAHRLTLGSHKHTLLQLVRMQGGCLVRGQSSFHIQPIAVDRRPSQRIFAPFRPVRRVAPSRRSGRTGIALESVSGVIQSHCDAGQLTRVAVAKCAVQRANEQMHFAPVST